MENPEGQAGNIYVLDAPGQNNEVPLWSGYFPLFI